MNCGKWHHWHHWHRAVFQLGLVIAVGVGFLGYAQAASLDQWLFWMIWPAMALHQAEENVFSEWFLGPRYRFLTWVREAGFDLTMLRNSALNFGIGWTLAIGAAYCGTRLIVWPLFVISVEVVNAFWHLSMTSHRQQWSPGTLSSVLVTIPLGFAIYYFTLAHGWAEPATLVATYLAGCLAHHLFFRSLPRIPQ
jgi:hypothetical protein